MEFLKFRRCVLTVPARIDLLGNPRNANGGDYATMSAAINIRAGISLEPVKGLVLELVASEAARTPQLRIEINDGAVMQGRLIYHGNVVATLPK